MLSRDFLSTLGRRWRSRCSNYRTLLSLSSLLLVTSAAAFMTSCTGNPDDLMNALRGQPPTVTLAV